MAHLPFAIAAFAGAFLLFLVELLIGKYLLPWFGGAPGVWATCLVFFQVAVLVGYAYAYALVRARPRAQLLIHLGLLAAAAATLPLTPSPDWVGDGRGDPTWRVLALLAVELGLPAIALCASAPLVSSWLLRLAPAAPVWRLYALSNLGSFLALIAFPLAIEPWVGRELQANAWSFGFIGYALIAASCAWAASRRPPAALSATPVTAAAPVSAGQRALWVALPACATVVLMGGTNVVVQDVAGAPLLWVLPLGLYLLSFVIAFAGERAYPRRTCMALLLPTALVVMATANPEALTTTLQQLIPSLPSDAAMALTGFGPQMTVHALAIFVGSLICHGELYRLRPRAEDLTGFYLAIAAGGVLGGLFVVFAAPSLFATYAEYRFGLLACCILVLLAGRPQDARRLPPWGWAAGLVGVCVLVAWFERVGLRAVAVERSFFGAMAVRLKRQSVDDAPFRELRHGGTRHGLQLRDLRTDLEPVDERVRRIATAYYAPESGAGRVLSATAAGGRRIGVIGLGVGTLATYATAADTVRFYELDPAVERLARTWFTYLVDCPGRVEVALGDARIRLAAEPSQAFDVLVVDAFSSDSIPMHLLTVEAFALYRRHLAPGGVLCVHVSNRHLDLAPVVRGGARALGWDCAAVVDEANAEEWWVHQSVWMLLVEQRRTLADPGLRALFPPLSAPSQPVIIWTDDRASLLSALR